MSVLIRFSAAAAARAARAFIVAVRGITVTFSSRSAGRRMVTLAGGLGVVVAVVAAWPPAASASRPAHQDLRASSRLTLAQGPQTLQAAVRKTQGGPATQADSAIQQVKLTAPDGQPHDVFGDGVAISGSTAVVGAPGANSGIGAAYVFVRSGTAWSAQAKLTPPLGTSTSGFGASVAISGSTVVVGAPGTRGTPGTAYVFVRSGTAWSQPTTLTSPHGTAGDGFGSWVAISGSTAAVSGANPNRIGAVYVFVRSGTTWHTQATLTDPVANSSDFFGNVAISRSTIVVGAFGMNSDTGVAYVLVRSGTAWHRQATLTAPSGKGSFFGNAVGLYGSTAVVSAPLFSPSGKTDVGAAYVYVRSGTAWHKQAKLIAADGATGDVLGNSVAVSGSTAVVSAGGASSNAGAVYVFVRSGTAWSQLAKLTAADAAPNDDLGYSVAIYGSTAVAGAVNKPFPYSNGAAYVFSGV